MSTGGPPATDQREVVVIGGGQAGLAIGYHLAKQGRHFTILEAAGEPAAAWRARWDSLELFTPVRYDSLPGLAFPGEPDSYPGRDDVVAYLTDYARHFELPVEFDSRAQSVRAHEAAASWWSSPTGRYQADQVVVATGPFQVPFTPPLAADLQGDVVQLHSSDYRSPADLAVGTTLVVGGGNTGFQIAAELARSRTVHLAVGARQTPVPQRILGRDVFRYLEATGPHGRDGDLAHRSADEGPRDPHRLQSPRRAQAGHPDAGARDRGRRHDRDLRRRHRPHGRSRGVGDRLPDSTTRWSTCRSSTRRAGGAPARRDRGSRPVLPRPPWQHTRGSALLGWVKDDARYLAETIGTLAETEQPARAR